MADLKAFFKIENIKARLSAFSKRLGSKLRREKSTDEPQPEHKSKVSFAYLKSRMFFINLLLIISVYLVLFLILLISINLGTQHNKTVKVPELYGYTLARAQNKLAMNDLKYVVFDSIYREDVPLGVIIDQHPKGNAVVKKGRKVYFTINARSAGQIPMPDLKGLTFRAAQPRLVAAGLRLGNLRYRYDMAVNEVLDMEVAGEPIQPGDIIMKGTPIDLVLGKGLGSDRTPVPNLIGLTYDEAQAKAAESYFTTSTPIPDESVSAHEDLTPFIYRQLPESNPNKPVQLGSQIILWVTTDSSKVVLNPVNDSILTNTPDGLIIQDDIDYADDGYDSYFDTIY